MVNKTSEFLRSASGLNGFLYLSVGEKETDQMIGGFARMVDVLKHNRKKNSGGLLIILRMQFIKTTLLFPRQKDLLNGGSI